MNSFSAGLEAFAVAPWLLNCQWRNMI